jgi:hypothetical protein
MRRAWPSARADGKYEGRKPTARAQIAEGLDTEGLQRTEIARRTGIGIASVYRVLADARKPSAGRGRSNDSNVRGYGPEQPRCVRPARFHRPRLGPTFGLLWASLN